MSRTCRALGRIHQPASAEVARIDRQMSRALAAEKATAQVALTAVMAGYIHPLAFWIRPPPKLPGLPGRTGHGRRYGGRGGCP